MWFGAVLEPLHVSEPPPAVADAMGKEDLPLNSQVNQALLHGLGLGAGGGDVLEHDVVSVRVKAAQDLDVCCLVACTRGKQY